MTTQQADLVHDLIREVTAAATAWNRLASARAETEAAALTLAAAARFGDKVTANDREVELIRKRRRRQRDALLEWQKADALVEVALEALAPQPNPAA